MWEYTIRSIPSYKNFIFFLFFIDLFRLALIQIFELYFKFLARWFLNRFFLFVNCLNEYPKGNEFKNFYPMKQPKFQGWIKENFWDKPNDCDNLYLNFNKVLSIISHQLNHHEHILIILSLKNLKHFFLLLKSSNFLNFMNLSSFDENEKWSDWNSHFYQRRSLFIFDTS